MRTLRTIATLILLGTSLAWAQNPPSSTSPPQAQPGQGQGRAGMQQEMQQMQASLQKMHALLNTMRSSYAGMDPKDKPAMQANIEMWQLLLDHMDKMAQHMQSMEPGGVRHHHEGPTPQQ